MSVRETCSVFQSLSWLSNIYKMPGKLNDICTDDQMAKVCLLPSLWASSVSTTVLTILLHSRLSLTTWIMKNFFPVPCISSKLSWMMGSLVGNCPSQILRITWWSSSSIVWLTLAFGDCSKWNPCTQGILNLCMFWPILWANFYCCPHLLMTLLWPASPFLNLKLGQLWYHGLTYWYRTWTQLPLPIWMFWMSLYRGTRAYMLQMPRRKDSLFSHLLRKHHSIWAIFSRQVPPPIETRSTQLICHLGESLFSKNSQEPGGGPVKVCTSTFQYWKSQTVITRRELKLNDVHFSLWKKECPDLKSLRLPLLISLAASPLCLLISDSLLHPGGKERILKISCQLSYFCSTWL